MMITGIIEKNVNGRFRRVRCLDFVLRLFIAVPFLKAAQYTDNFLSVFFRLGLAEAFDLRPASLRAASLSPGYAGLRAKANTQRVRG